MVYRVYVEKKSELANEARALLSDARTLLGIKNLENVRILNRYDAENISDELFEYAKKTEYKGKTIVVLLPDSGDRYYSTALFTE